MKLPEPLRSWPELRIRHRIALSLGAIATLATLLTLVVPHDRLAGDLEQAGLERLERSTAATLELLATLQAHVQERHRAMARTPEFRANLETAHVLGLEVIVEGVEKARQQAILGEIGCEMVQRYFYSEGVSAEQIPEILGKGFAGLAT